MKKVPIWHTSSLTRIKPQGWIQGFLNSQKNGLTGHLEVAGYPFNTEGWLADHLPLGERGGAGWWPYEQFAYWVDGMIRCGLLLDDDLLKKKARRHIDHVLAHPDADGYLGPDAMKSLVNENGSERWPHAVFFRSILADHDERPSAATLRKLIRHYLSNTALHVANRNVCNIEIMAWLYEMTGDRRMRDLAEKSFAGFQKKEVKDGATLANMSNKKRIGDHGPRHMELFKLGAIMYRITGKSAYLKATLNAHRKLKRDHVLIDGVPSSTEHLRGVYSTAGHETCVISDYLWSLGHLLAVTGDAGMADEMEKICFNALPGAVTPDFKSLQYFSGPNQVVAGPQTNHHPHGIACTHISFRPSPGTECCPGNVHRAMPAFAGRMWFEDGNGGVIAALYGPSQYVAGKGRNKVTITEETAYPFSDQVVFRFACKEAVSMPFTFRIPGWCRKASVLINGKAWKRKFKSGTYVTMTRTFVDGDAVTVILPKEVRIARGPEQSAGVEWGPIVLSLRIREKRKIEQDNRSSDEFPAWTIEPATPWNFGLILQRGKLPGNARFDTRILTALDNPWTGERPPVVLAIKARRIPGWKLIRKKQLVLTWGDKKRVIKGDIQFMPSMPDEAVKAKASRREMEVELIPYGATRLRVTWFPVVT